LASNLRIYEKKRERDSLAESPLATWRTLSGYEEVTWVQVGPFAEERSTTGWEEGPP